MICSKGTVRVPPIVPEKSGISRFSASHFLKNCTLPSIYRCCMVYDAILNEKGCNSVEQKIIVPGALGTIIS